MKDYKEFWNKISARYDTGAMKKYKDAYKQTIELSKKYLKSSDYVFDFACGTGITTIPLSKYVGKTDAIDTSPKMISIAKKKASVSNVQNTEFTATHIFDERIEENVYDVVMAFNIL